MREKVAQMLTLLFFNCLYYYEKGYKEHLGSFVSAYNYAKRLKTLKGLSPYEFS